SPMSSEGTGRSPGKKACQSQEDDGQDEPPEGKRTLPEPALPQEGVGRGHQQDPPACASIDLGGLLAAAPEQDEGSHPDDPSEGEHDVGVGWHSTWKYVPTLPGERSRSAGARRGAPATGRPRRP